MIKEIPRKYQQRLSHDVLVSLSNALLDGTVFQIVTGISELQRMEEAHLFSERNSLITSFNEKREQLILKQKAALHEVKTDAKRYRALEEENKAELELFERQRREEIIRHDCQIIRSLDNKVTEQQTILTKAGVALFHTTNDPEEVRLQMYLLNFITRLNQM